MQNDVRFDPLGLQAFEKFSRARREVLCRAFTAIELVGVLTVIALLAAAVFPTVIRRIDQAAWTKETADLNTIADAYTQCILRNKTIPNLTNWASSVASQLSLPVSAVTNTPRGIPRVFLVDLN